jgi:hypothetical protein
MAKRKANGRVRFGETPRYSWGKVDEGDRSGASNLPPDPFNKRNETEINC